MRPCARINISDKSLSLKFRPVLQRNHSFEVFQTHVRSTSQTIMLTNCYNAKFGWYRGYTVAIDKLHTQSATKKKELTQLFLLYSTKIALLNSTI